MDSVNDTETLQDIIEKKDIGYSVKKITFSKEEKIDYIDYLLNKNKAFIYVKCNKREDKLIQLKKKLEILKKNVCYSIKNLT